MNTVVYTPTVEMSGSIVDICAILFHSRVVHGIMLDASVLFMATTFTVIPMGEMYRIRLPVE